MVPSVFFLLNEISMTIDTTTKDLTGMVVLLPTGSGHDNDLDDVRCNIERLQGEVAYALPPKRPHGAYGREPDEATHEYVPTGACATTNLPVLTAEALQATVKASQQKALDRLAPFGRKAYVPVVNAIEHEEQGQESRYFGAPWLPEGMVWPMADDEPMRFVLQLNTTTLPMELPALAGKQGLLLFFNDENGDDSHVELVDMTQAGGVHHLPGFTDTNTPLAITAWHDVLDMPHRETLPSLDGHTEAFEDVLMGVGSDRFNELKTTDGRHVPEREAVEQGIAGAYHTYSCDKLGGWPDWAQGDETPGNGEDQPMAMVMQIGHEGLLLDDEQKEAIDWPTWGRGQIFASPTTGELTYVWACD